MQEITDSSIPDGGTVEYRLITPSPPVYMTISLLRPYCFDPNVKATESFYYFKYTVNATISLLPSGFYCPTMVASTEFHCSRDMILAEVKIIWFFWPSFESVLVMVCLYHPTRLCLYRLWRWLQLRLITSNNTQPNEHTQPTYEVTLGFKPFTVLRSLGRQSEPINCKPQKLWHWRWLL